MDFFLNLMKNINKIFIQFFYYAKKCLNSFFFENLTTFSQGTNHTADINYDRFQSE